MRLYVEDPVTKERIFINKLAKNRRELASAVGAKEIKVNNKIYAVSDQVCSPAD